MLPYMIILGELGLLSLFPYSYHPFVPKWCMLCGNRHFLYFPQTGTIIVVTWGWHQLCQYECLVQIGHGTDQALQKLPIQTAVRWHYMNTEIRVDPIRSIGIEDKFTAKLKT